MKFKSDKPKLTDQKTVAKSNLFEIEALSLDFSNGEQRTFERISGNNKRGSILVAAISEANDLMLVREYGAGLDQMVLAFPKGLVDEGETPQQAADRELMEEIGWRGNEWLSLGLLAASPGYMTSQTHVFAARDLTPKQLEGDEPQPLDLIRWPISKIADLISNPEFVDARSVAALFYLQQSGWLDEVDV